MIASIIDRLTRASLRFKWVTLGLALLALVAGILALTQLKQELMPAFSFPANIVLALNQDAKAETMRDQVTIPIENAVQGIEGVVSVQSTTSDGVAVVTIMNKFGLDEEVLRDEVRDAIEGLTYPAGMATPELLTFGMDDLPLVYASISADRPLAELKGLVEADIVPALEAVPGIADVQVSGGQELPAEPAPTQEPAAQPTPEPTPTAEPTPTTAPAGGGSKLPLMWQTAGKAQGINLAVAGDVTPQIIRQLAGAAPQLLEMLTPDNLRDLTPEVLAWLPASYIEKLDPELRAELDQLAQPAGGLGALAVKAEAEAAALAAHAPPLSGAWVQPQEGSTTGPTFETAADLITSGYADSAARLLNLLVANMPQAPQLMADLTPDVVAWLVGQEEGFLENLSPTALRLLSPAVLSSLPESFYAGLDPDLRAELQGIASGTVTAFIPENTAATVDGNPGLILMIYKDGEANTVSTSHDLYAEMEALKAAYPGLRFNVTFEQASFIEESISGVAREGLLGALFAVIVILIFLSGTVNGHYRLGWRSTLVAGVSIPLSVFMAFALLTWLPSVTDVILVPLANATQDIPVLGTIVALIHSLFPADFTLNILTLSGMTVAVGRVVDDSIVVLENTYRHIQRGEDRRQAVLTGVHDVSIAILASTVTTVIVFLPIGLIGGIVGQFFLPFGITVAYALGSSFLVAVTVVPLLTYLLIRKENIPEPKETSLQRWYTPALQWALRHRAVILAIAGVLFAGSMLLLAQQPRALMPEMGEPRISVNVDLPEGATMSETVALAAEFEQSLEGVAGLGTIQSEVGSAGGMMGMASRMLGMGGSIDQGLANIAIGVEDAGQIDELTVVVRQKAEQVFGPDNAAVSGGSLLSSAMGGLSLILTGDPEKLADVNDEVITALEGIDGLTNVTSNLAEGNAILRVDGQSAVEYTGEVETQDAMGLAATAKAKVQAMLPPGITASEGYQSEQQTRAFQEALQAMLISIAAVYLVMVITFRSLIQPFTILFSLPLAIIGVAAVVWLTGSEVDLTVLVGLMMLVGIVVTNAIVLIARVQTNQKERGMDTQEALVEGGRTRLRPILMTAIATILALTPLAIGLSQGGLIASGLASVVIGGLVTSTLLTLVVVPVVYSLLDWLANVKRKKQEATPQG
jgi:multidrug efflux pump subunit AcrB